MSMRSEEIPMKMTFNVECLLCHINKTLKVASSLGDEKTNRAFARELMQLYDRMPENAFAPWLAPHTAQLLNRDYGVDFDRYAQEKRDSNAFVMERLEQQGAVDEVKVLRKQLERIIPPVWEDEVYPEQ